MTWRSGWASAPQFSEGRSAAQWVQHFLDQSEVPDHDAFRRTGLYLAPDQERVGWPTSRVIPWPTR